MKIDIRHFFLRKVKLENWKTTLYGAKAALDIQKVALLEKESGTWHNGKCRFVHEPYCIKKTIKPHLAHNNKRTHNEKGRAVKDTPPPVNTENIFI